MTMRWESGGLDGDVCADTWVLRVEQIREYDVFWEDIVLADWVES